MTKLLATVLLTIWFVWDFHFIELVLSVGGLVFFVWPHKADEQKTESKKRV